MRRCAAVAGLIDEGDCLGSGRQVARRGTQTAGQSSLCFNPLLLRTRTGNTGFEIMDMFSDLSVLC